MLGDDGGQREAQLAETRSAHRRNLEDAVTACFKVGTHQISEIPSLGHVDLVQGDDLGALEQRQLPLGNGIGGEFREDHIEIGERIATRIERRAVQHVHERRAALDMPQELQAESAAAAGPFDQAGHISDGEAHVTGFDDSKVRMESRERVISDLRARS